jgi:hypothetical protein
MTVAGHLSITDYDLCGVHFPELSGFFLAGAG